MRGDDFFTGVLHEPPFTKLHPKTAAFFKEYLAHEKVTAFGDRHVFSTHFPPYPSPAFDNLVEHFNRIGEARDRRLFSVTLAITNRCNYNCWHCYNAGRNQHDTPLDTLNNVARELQELKVVHVTLTGGEPLLRSDLEQVAAAFDARTYLSLNTTGAGLTPARAHALYDSGVFAMGISIDSTNPEQHDRMRGKEGAFHTALDALEMASAAGLYPYIIAVATHEFLQHERFEAFMEFAQKAGAREVHLLEPSATGKLSGRSDVLLRKSDRQRVLDYQQTMAERDDLPILSSFLYLESPDAFGCGAGLTHLYVDGSGEVCPCNLVPLSFGNITREPLLPILDRMGSHFCKPRPSCVGRILAKHIDSECLPLDRLASAKLCEKHLPKRHTVPRFFQVRAEAQGDVGPQELKAAYDLIHEHYDAFWLVEAGKPIEQLVEMIPLDGSPHVLEAGCGTGFATVLLAAKLPHSGTLTAVDISDEMLGEARIRAKLSGFDDIEFIAGDALRVLETAGPLDLVFSSWVLGYIPVNPFLRRACDALEPGGLLAFVVHKDNSPREPMEIYRELVARDPSILEKRVAFDFPRDMEHAREALEATGFDVKRLWDGNVTFRYDTPEQVLEHLLKSGAGTAFDEAVDPRRRELLRQEFVRSLAARHRCGGKFAVVHDYISCVARKR